MLNAKQERFCQEYIKCGNATEAMINAGYNPKYAGTNSTKLLKNTNVHARILELNEEIKNKNIADAREMQETLTEIIRQQKQEEVIVIEGKGSLTKAVKKKKKASFKDVVLAIDKLARMQGCYNEKMTMSMEVPVFKGEGDLE